MAISGFAGGIAVLSLCHHGVLTVFSPCSHRVLNCGLNRVLTVFSPCCRPCSHLVRARSVLVVVAHRSHRGLTVFSKCYRSVPAVVSQCSHRTPLCSHCVLTPLTVVVFTVFSHFYHSVPAVLSMRARRVHTVFSQCSDHALRSHRVHAMFSHRSCRVLTVVSLLPHFQLSFCVGRTAGANAG